MTHYEIELHTSAAHQSALHGSGVTCHSTSLRYDGEAFREGSFDVDKWTDEGEALRAFHSLAEGDDFAPGLEIVLIRFDENEEAGEVTATEIATQALNDKAKA
jgi:hypothetical protein